MRSTLTLLFPLLLTGVAGNMAVSPRQNVDLTQAQALPACVTTCSSQVLPVYDCQITQPCFCNNTQLAGALESCISTNCTIPDGIAAKKFQADTCGYPVRSMVDSSMGVLWAFFTIAIVFSILRCISRCRMLGGAGYWWDDWTLLACVLPMIGFTITGYLGLEDGMGKDYWEVSVGGIEESMKLFYAGQPLYIAVVFGTKVSLVLLYLRIWSKDSRRLNQACWIAIALLLACLISFEFATIFQCIPVSYNWTSVVDSNATGSCTARASQLYAAAAFNIIFDILVLLLPVPSLLKLNISWLKKLGVGIVFVVGILVTICSIVRLQYLAKYSNSTNVTWDYTYIGLWSLLEVHLSIVCVCTPAAAGLFYRTWRQVSNVSPTESIDMNEHGSTGGDEKRFITGDDVNRSSRIVQTNAQVSGLGLTNMDLEEGKSDSASDSPPGFDEMWTNLGDKEKKRPAYELHGDSKDSHTTGNSRPVLRSQAQSNESNILSDSKAQRPGISDRPGLNSQAQSNESDVLGSKHFRPSIQSRTQSQEGSSMMGVHFPPKAEREQDFEQEPEQEPHPALHNKMQQLKPKHSYAVQMAPPMVFSSGASQMSQERPSLQSPRYSKDDQSIREGGRPAFASPGYSEYSQDRPVARSYFSQDNSSMNESRPRLNSAGQSQFSRDRSVAPSTYSRENMHMNDSRPYLDSAAQSQFSRDRSVAPSTYSRDNVSMNDGRPGLFAAGQSQMSQGRPDWHSRGYSRDDQSMRGGRPGMFNAWQSEQSQDRPYLHSRGYSRDDQSMRGGRPGLYSPGQSQYSDNRGDFQWQGNSRDDLSMRNGRPGLWSPDQSQFNQQRPSLDSPGYTKESYGMRDMRPPMLSPGQSQYSRQRSSTQSDAYHQDYQQDDSHMYDQRPSPLSPGPQQSKMSHVNHMARPAMYSPEQSKYGQADEDDEAKIAAAQAMVGVGALGPQESFQPSARSSMAQSPKVQSPQAKSPQAEKDQNEDLAATIADALVGVRAMQQQIENRSSTPPSASTVSPSKASSGEDRNDSATEVTDKLSPVSSPYSMESLYKSYSRGDKMGEVAPGVDHAASSPLSPLGSPNSMAGRDHPLRSRGRQPSFEGEKMKQRAVSIENEARERPLHTPKTPKSPYKFETVPTEEEQRRIEASEVAAPEAVTAATTIAAVATVPAAATAALGEHRELARRSRSESQLRDDTEERRKAEAWQPVTPTMSRSASHEDHPLNKEFSSNPQNNPYEEEQMRKGASTQTDFPYESEENLTSPEPPMSPEMANYKRARAAESEAALADAYNEHMDRTASEAHQRENPSWSYREEHEAAQRAARAARKAAKAAEGTTPSGEKSMKEMMSKMASAVGEIGDQPAEEQRNREGMEEVAAPEAADHDDHPLRGLRTSGPIATPLEADQAAQLAIADSAPPPTLHRSRSNSRTSRPDPVPVQRASRASAENHDDEPSDDDDAAPPPMVHRSRSNSTRGGSHSRGNSRGTSRSRGASGSRHSSWNKYIRRNKAGEDSGCESATEGDHPLRSQGKSGPYSRPNSRPTSFVQRRLTANDSGAESANEDDHPLRSQGKSGLYQNRADSSESIDAAQQRNASVNALSAAAQRRQRQQRRTSANSAKSVASDSSTEILYEGRPSREKVFKSFVAEPQKSLGRTAYASQAANNPYGAGRGYVDNSAGYPTVGRGRPVNRQASPAPESFRVQVTQRPGSGGSRELRMPFRDWNGEDER